MTEDFVRRTLRYAGNNGDDFLADKAREALEKIQQRKRPMTKSTIITAITLGTLTVVTGGFVGWTAADLAAKQAALTEAVNMVEEAARTIQEDMEILRNIAAREECYANRGEWSDEYGCYLEEVVE